ncbi:MAG TPA: CDP-alcohol phosphatidyltransferase family protein [Alphaproteobacteria bacterium]|nr:CDP-alcohol phosphatidyltransferase family protein [Alphaproteobacteria bacterium]
MLDPFLRKVIAGPLDRAGAALARRGIRPDGVTFIGFGLGVAAALALAFRLDGLAALLMLANRLCDGLDGAVARAAGTSDLGGYYDIVFDFVFYSGIVFGFAVGRPEAALPAAFLIFSFVGTGTSFLAYAVIAAKRNLTTSLRGPKAFFHVGGLAEGTETIAALLAICLFAPAFEWIAYGFGALCWVTTAGRVLAARRAFGA